MLRVLTVICLCLALAAPFAGCGSSICDDACDKFEECGVGNCTVSGECNAQAECVSTCIVNASCADLTDILNPANPYFKCVAACPQ